MDEIKKNRKIGGVHPFGLDWIDVAKGMGLVLVIWGHLLYRSTWEMVNRAIYSFHMPMYFVLSGYLYNPHQELYSDFFYENLMNCCSPR